MAIHLKLTVQSRGLQYGTRSAVDYFDTPPACDGQDSVKGRMVGKASQALLVATQATVSQHNPV